MKCQHCGECKVVVKFKSGHICEACGESQRVCDWCDTFLMVDKDKLFCPYCGSYKGDAPKTEEKPTGPIIA